MEIYMEYYKILGKGWLFHDSTSIFKPTLATHIVHQETQYGEEDILTLNLYEDIEKGDLDIITWILCTIILYLVCYVYFF